MFIVSLSCSPSLVYHIVVPWVQVSNAFYASLTLLKASNPGGLPSLPLLVFRCFIPRSLLCTLFGYFLAIYWSCKIADSNQLGYVGPAP